MFSGAGGVQFIRTANFVFRTWPLVYKALRAVMLVARYVCKFHKAP